MRIISFAAGNDASAHYRITQPTAVLANQGVDAVIGDAKACDIGIKAAESDLLVVQRPHQHDILKMIDSAHEHGVAVCVDLDDDFDHLDRRHGMFHGITEQIKATTHLVCQAADVVTVTTPKLAEIYGYGHSVVIPNYVPRSMLDVFASDLKEPEDILVGWTGTVSSHPNDLQQMGNGLRRAIEESPGSRFVHIGNPQGVDKAAGIRHLKSFGSLPYRNYLEAYASFDVAVAPLDDTTFNASKSALKGLEAAALGVPFVASPTPDYRRLATDGIGTLAANPSDWRREVGKLLRDESLRYDTAMANQEAVLRRHTLEGNIDRWHAAFQLAILNLKQLSSVPA